MVIRGCRGKKGNLQARVADTYDDNGNMLKSMDTHCLAIHGHPLLGGLTVGGCRGKKSNLPAQVADNAQSCLYRLVGSVKMMINGAGNELLRAEEVEKGDTFSVTELGHAVSEEQHLAA